MSDRDYMRAWQTAEELRRWPDAQYTPTAEDDPHDPEQREIVAMVVEQDAADNARRRERELMEENAMLRQMLEERGVDVSSAIDGF